MAEEIKKENNFNFWPVIIIVGVCVLAYFLFFKNGLPNIDAQAGDGGK